MLHLTSWRRSLLPFLVFNELGLVIVKNAPFVVFFYYSSLSCFFDYSVCVTA